MYRKENPITFGLTLIIMILLFTYGILILPSGLFENPEIKTRIDIYFSASILIFAIVEGLSTYLQVIDNRNMRKFQDLQNQLENCYGPLIIILIRNIGFMTLKEMADNEGYVYELNREERMHVDKIVETYPHILSHEIISSWNYIRKDKSTKEGGVMIDNEFAQQVEKEHGSLMMAYQSHIE